MFSTAFFALSSYAMLSSSFYVWIISLSATIFATLFNASNAKTNTKNSLMKATSGTLKKSSIVAISPMNPTSEPKNQSMTAKSAAATA